MNGLNMKQWNFQRHLFGFDGLLLISDNVGVILLPVGSLGVIRGTPKQNGGGGITDASRQQTHLPECVS